MKNEKWKMRNENLKYGEQEIKRGGSLTSSVLGYPDSNQERQDQNLQCYHYTIAQSVVLYAPHL